MVRITTGAVLWQTNNTTDPQISFTLCLRCSHTLGYLFILGFPLAVVIPMAAFRSLAREYEDETIQLVSITSMSARRIILGKLGSAFLQIIMYLAAVTPCIVFSYILRGISFSMIFCRAEVRPMIR